LDAGHLLVFGDNHVEIYALPTLVLTQVSLSYAHRHREREEGKLIAATSVCLVDFLLYVRTQDGWGSALKEHGG
jgi:hypothetical protein